MQTVQSILTRIPAWQNSREIHTERIGGLTNTNYRVTVDGEVFVLRVSGQNTQQLGINRSHEYAALKNASAAGIAPEVIAFLQPEDHLVTRWVKGRHWQADEFRTPDHVRLLTETVKRIHTLPVNGATFSPFQRTTDFYNTAQKFGVAPPLGLKPFFDTMSKVQTDQENDPGHWLCFCHNDLVSVNYLYLEQKHQIQVLDWEFSGMGDIYYDLAAIVYTHDSDGPISPELEDVMLTCYFEEITAWQKKRLLGMKYMLLVFTAMWGLAQFGMQQAGLISAVEGFDYLEFAQYLFAHDVSELQAQYQNQQAVHIG